MMAMRFPGAFLRRCAVAMSLLMAVPPPPFAASAHAADAAASDSEAETFNTEQLDAMLAPIALYPDVLLTQILMASGDPLDIVQAARWRADGANKDLAGDALVKALAAQQFAPATKSLIAFPQVLAMLNDHLDWTQQLGWAFAEQQADVMDSVQRLRRQAQGAGNLQTTAQQTVAMVDDAVVIEPARPDVVFVPSYNPATVFGPWPYAAVPPVVLPPPPGYAIGTALATGLAFGAGVALTSALWNIGRPNWRGRNVNVNVNRYNNLAVNRTRVANNQFRPRPPVGAGGRRLGPPAGPVGRPARSVGLPPNAIGRPSVSVPASAVNRPGRSPGAGQPLPNRPAGGLNRPGAPVNRPGLGANRPGGTQINRPGGTAVNRPGGGARPPANRPPVNRPGGGAGNRPSVLNGTRDGHQAGALANRGSQSRAAHQANRPAIRPGGGGGGRAGGGAGRIQRP